MTSQDTDRTAISHLISRIGETDQEYLSASTPLLALQRAKLRLELVRFSHQKNEKVYFLSEAAMLLELAITESEEVLLNATLSAGLAEVYLEFYQTTLEDRYITIVNQILKPLTHLDQHDIMMGLARASAAKQHSALTQHWLSRWSKLGNTATNDLLHYPEFQHFQQEGWFSDLLKQKMH